MMTYYFRPRRRLHRSYKSEPVGFNGGRRMPVDFHADDEQYVLTAVVPGLKAEDLQIEIEDNVLTLRAEAKAQDEKSGNYLLREILPGEYLRRFRLPETADAEKAEAKVENGILTLRIPKVEAARPKKIEVQAV